ncbi:MAG: Fis family transcriptional regulator, partial [Oribacterium sp.]
MEKLSILRESVSKLEDSLKLEEITVERAVFGLFFSGVKLSTG